MTIKKFEEKNEELKEIKSYCTTYFPEMCEKVIQTADLLCQQKFIFNMEWDMEQTHECVEFKEDIQWEYMPEDDPEWMYALNRHRYWIFLGQAYQLTGEIKYIDAFKKQLRSWVAKEPFTEDKKQTTWRSIEAGLRLEYWLHAYALFSGSGEVDAEFKTLFYEVIQVHCGYLMEEERPFGVISNWGVIENAGLYLGGAALGNECYMEKAMERLEKALEVQLFNDGVHWEQSPMYHNEVLICLLGVYHKSRYEKIKFKDKAVEKIYQMAMVNVAWKKPNGTEFCQGDSDDFDLRDIITKSCVLFQDPIFKGTGYERLDFMNAWEFGKEGIELYDSIRKDMPTWTSTALESSGNYYMRSNWEENGHVLHFSNGSVGGGHGHCEKLHIDLVAHGEDVLIDSGRYTYVDKPIRHQLKSCYAHNGVLVNEQDYMKTEGAWGYQKLAQRVQQPYILNAPIEFIEGAHLGDMNQGAYVQRRVVYIKPDIFVVSDLVVSQEEKTITQLLHFAPQGEVTADGNRILFESQKNYVQIQSMSSDKISLETQPHSYFYNQLEEHSMAKIVKKNSPRMSSTFVIDINETKEKCGYIESVPVKSVGDFTNFDTEQLECVKIEKQGVTYLVFFANVEAHANINMFEACGVQFVGQVAVIKIEAEHVERYVLQR